MHGHKIASLDQGWEICKLIFDISTHLQMKHRAPHNHTILEIVRVRWGVTAHIVFFFFAVGVPAAALLRRFLRQSAAEQGRCGCPCVILPDSQLFQLQRWHAGTTPH